MEWCASMVYRGKLQYPAPMLHRALAMAGLACLVCVSACKSDLAATKVDSGTASKGDAAGPDVSVAPEVKGRDADTAAADRLAVEDSAGDTRSENETSAMDRPGADALADGVPAMDLGLGVPGIDGGGDAGCTGWTTLVHLKPAEVANLLATSDPIVINVHGPGADIPGVDVYISFNQVDKIESYLKYDHCADVLLLCLGGGMSISAGNELVRRGYLRVRDIYGGVSAWVAAGYPVLKDGGT